MTPGKEKTLNLIKALIDLLYYCFAIFKILYDDSITKFNAIEPE
jgi:hypothetical protein